MYILHVDDDATAHAMVRSARDRVARAADVIVVETMRSALPVLSSVRVGCVVSEVGLWNAAHPSDVVGRIRAVQPGVPVVILSSGPSAQASPAGHGSWECLCKGEADVAAVATAIGAALGGRLIARASEPSAVVDGPLVTRFGGCDFIVGTAAMRHVLQLIEAAAESDVTVLLEGETGTGKEILARALHARSARRSAPLVVQNCGAVAEQLLESELFGHVRGAFTGAERDRAGLFLEAGQGTVFLDEIGEASPTVQARLLRVLQHQEVKPVGSDRVQRACARIVAATNRPLIDEVRAGRFRADLYYRLAVLPIRVPPLRERAGDVARLANHFLAGLALREGHAGIELSGAAVEALTRYDWPGNVRELEHEVHRVVLTIGSGKTVEVEHLAPHIRGHSACRRDEPLEDMMARVEMALIRERLERFPTKADAARSLGITREGLYAKLRRLGMWSANPA